VVGQVKSVKKAGRVTGTSQLGVELTNLTLVDGEQAPVLTELWKASGGTSHGADATTIAGGTGLGAAIGAAADWGRGAAIGAGAGAVVGIGAVLLTRGRPTILAPESQLVVGSGILWPRVVRTAWVSAVLIHRMEHKKREIRAFPESGAIRKARELRRWFCGTSSTETGIDGA
jgi:hypothetical protein